MVRCFIAVEINEEQRASLVNMQNRIKESGADIKYVEAGNLHLTLKFLGDVFESNLEKLKQECGKSIENKTGFKMGLHGLGVFPSFNYIKVIWAGVKEGSQELVDLANSLNQNITIGKQENKKFHPHITLGRVKSARNRDKLIEKIKEFQGLGFGGTEVNEIKLKKSELKPEGPVYSDLESFEL